MVSGKPMYAHPRYPVYDRTVTEKMLFASVEDRDVAWLNNQRIMCFSRIDREALNESMAKEKDRVAPWTSFIRRDKPLWEYDCQGSVAVALCGNAVVVAGEKEIVALSLEDGDVLWKKPLPATPVSYGLAVDSDGRVVVTLEDGRVLCFG
jgi:outer membrane protein assembly factor BamB